MNWQIVDRDALLARSGHDRFAVCEAGSQDIALVSEAGWALLYSADAQRAGATVVFDSQPDAVVAGATWAQLADHAAALGWRLCWLSAPEGMDLPGTGPWHHEGHWVWMSTTELSGAPDARWRLVELDDDRDAAEIMAFALPINPRFEGDPGQGKNLFWLAARDADGHLIGCGTAHRTPAGVGHLAGIVVDPALRRQGLGRALVLALSQRLIDLDGIATLSAYADNHNAIALYRSVGYRLDHAFHSRFLEARRSPCQA